MPLERKKVGKYLEKICPWLLRENKWYVVVYDESDEIRYSSWLLLCLDFFFFFFPLPKQKPKY